MKLRRMLILFLALALLVGPMCMAEGTVLFQNAAKEVRSRLLGATPPPSNEPTVEPTPAPAEGMLLLSSHALKLGMEDRAALSYTLTPVSTAAVEFVSSDLTVAAVDGKGKITPIAPGECEIIASTVGGARDVCVLTVCPAPQQILLRIPSAELGVKESSKLEVEFQPEGSYAEVTFSSDSRRVSLEQDGTVTALRTGSATITATTRSGLQGKLKLSMLKSPKSISLEISEDHVAVGGMVFASCTFPKGSGGGYSLSTPDSDLISFTSDGGVIGLAPGVAQIIATSYNGKTASRSIRVPDVPDALYLPAEMKLGVGGSAVLPVTLPEGSASSLYFESLNPEIVSAEESSGLMRGLQLGEAIVRVYAVNSPATAECIVRVLPAPEQLLLSETEILLCVGQSCGVECAFLPENSFSSLRLTSDAPQIVSVEDGVLVGSKEGSAQVTVETENGLSAVILVQVLPAPKAISLNAEQIDLSTGETFQLAYELTEGSLSSVRFSSSAPEIAEVDAESGLITAASTGTAIITAVTDNGLFACCTVNVNIDLDPKDTVSGDFEIAFMNIGRNDGILIRCGGEYAFIDSGRYSYGEKAVKFMQERGVKRLKYYIGTHAHSDHIEGGIAILENIPVDMIVVPREYAYKYMISCCSNEQQRKLVRATPHRLLTYGQRLYIGGAKITCVGPVTVNDRLGDSYYENGNSLVTRISYGSNSFLLTGDATKDELREILKNDPDALRSDLYKNPHHNQSLPADVLTKIAPKITVFSTDSSSRPNWRHKKLLDELGSIIYNTSSGANGHVFVSSDGEKITIRTQNSDEIKEYSSM